MKRRFLILCVAVLPAAAFGQLALPEAVDTPSLVWTTGGDVTWQGVAAGDARAGGDLARCGPLTLEPYAWGDETSGWMETMVTGPGTFRVFVRSNGDAYLSAHLSMDGAVVDLHEPVVIWRQFGEEDTVVRTGWRALSCAVPPGSHRIRITGCLLCDEAGTIPMHGPLLEADAAELLPVDPALGEAMDAPGFTWFTGGDVLFSTVNDVTHDGADGLRGVAPSGASWLETSVTGPATVSWWSKGSAGVSVAGMQVSGVLHSDWTLEKFFVPAGTHRIRWGSPAFLFPPTDVWLDQLSSQFESAVGLAEALDVPARVFTGSAGWQAHTSAAAPDGVDMAWTAVSNEAQWIETTVTGPAVVFFSWRVRGTGVDVTAQVDGHPVRYSYGLDAGENSSQPFVLVPPGEHTVRWAATPWSYAPARALVMLDAVRVESMSVEALPAALDAPGLTWTTGGSAAWFGNAGSVAADGVDFAASPALAEGQAAWLEAALTGPGHLSFQRRRATSDSSERRVIIDGGMIKTIPPASADEWVHESVELPAGAHTVRFESRGEAGPGAFCLDRAIWTPADVTPVAGALDFQPLAVYAEDGVFNYHSPGSVGSDALLMYASANRDNTLVMWVRGPARMDAYLNSDQARLSVSSPSDKRLFPILSPFPDDFWTPMLLEVPPGIVPVSFVASHNPDWAGLSHTAFLDGVKLTNLTTSLELALGTPGRAWRTSAGNPWSGIATTGGILRASPGAAATGGTPWLETDIAGPAVITFTAGGTLQLLLDGNRAVVVNPFSQSPAVRTFYVPKGLHTVRWEHSVSTNPYPYLSGVAVAAMSAEPVLSRSGSEITLTIPRPAGFPDSRIRMEGTGSSGAFSVLSTTTVRTNAQELVLRAAVQPGWTRYFVRAAFLP